jgi:hypothetical protein
MLFKWEKNRKYTHKHVDEFPQQLEIVGAKLHYLELASESYTCKVNDLPISSTREENLQKRKGNLKY